ncbi:MAG: hypothetical protein ACLT9W_05180 [Streptococcus sp.]
MNRKWSTKIVIFTVLIQTGSEVAGHSPRQGRNQFVLDFSREVVDAIYEQMARVIEETKSDYTVGYEPSVYRCLSKSLARSARRSVSHHI